MNYPIFPVPCTCHRCMDSIKRLEDIQTIAYQGHMSGIFLTGEYLARQMTLRFCISASRDITDPEALAGIIDVARSRIGELFNERENTR